MLYHTKSINETDQHYNGKSESHNCKYTVLILSEYAYPDKIIRLRECEFYERSSEINRKCREYIWILLYYFNSSVVKREGMSACIKLTILAPVSGMLEVNPSIRDG